MKETIEFKQQRELGAIITDMFKFVRLEGKKLGMLILKITAPALVALVFSYIYYAQTTLGNIEIILTQQNFSNDIILSVFLLLISALVFYALLYSSVFLYIKSYIAHNGQPDTEEVSNQIKHYFWSVAGLNILVGIITMVGLILCVLPGIYLMVCLSLSYPILIFDRNDVGEAISNSFKLIKDEWWNTFASLFVIYILYSLIGLIFQLPQFFYFLVKGISLSQEASSDVFVNVDWVTISLDLIAMLAGYFLFTLVLISIAFIYFHLNEKKNYTGTLETIDKLGSQ